MSTSDARILVVDDNEDNLYTLNRRLNRLGYTEIQTATNGAEALAKLAETPFDIVLLDIMMPEMDGYETLDRIKKDSKLRHIPVIMISAADELDSIVRCIELGAEDFLPKPFNPTLLRARISASLEKKQLRDREETFRAQIVQEKRRADDLLYSIIPAPAVRELNRTGVIKSRRHEDVAVLFCDIVGFTMFCDQNSPEIVVDHLQTLFEAFEGIIVDAGMEKIKTIGDEFMATAGLLHPLDRPLLTAVRCGLEFIKTARALEPYWDVRVGIHFGPLVAGIVGKRQFLFDVWGDTVNVAARLTPVGEPGTVTMIETVWREIQYESESRSLGVVSLKGKGDVEVVDCYAVEGADT